MLINFIKVVTSFTLGALLMYFYTSNTTPPQTSVDYTVQSSVDDSLNISAANTQRAEVERTSELAQIQHLNQVIESQRLKINQLQSMLEQPATVELDDKKTELAEERKSLETISMEDFENEVKDKFINRFKGYAIELKPEQLVEIKKTFEREQEKSVWSAEFENQIGDFINSANINGLHFINELNCSTSICRLNVQTNEVDQWQKVYGDMTNQAWYKSITFTEKTDTPGNFIYYIPKS